MGTPLELIKYNTTNGKFEIGAAALDTLRKVKGPVAVVAVSGRARQGKSFILNQLLQNSGGFQVGATHRPCTKGLWMWSTPQRLAAPDGSIYHLVLLDTEGIDAYDQTAQYSTQIFSLAVLLSSLFVYNQMGGIDESALDRLSLVTEMTKHVRVRAANGRAGGEENLGEHSPAFLWLLRDFYLQLEEEGGRRITPRDYLETALRLVPGSGPSIEAKNAIRASISQLFPQRDCFTLVRPMNDEAALSRMDTLPRDKLRPEFRQGVKDLTALIFQRAVPKRFGTQFMTGPVLAGLVHAYVMAINQGAVPTIATAWQGVAESECRRGGDAAEAAYVAAWASGGEVPAEEAELEARHQQCLAAARAAYEEVAVGDEAIRRANEARWMAAVAGRYKDLRGRRLAEAAAAVNELLYKGANEVAQAIHAGADLSAIQQRITAFLTKYEKAAAGPTKWQKLAAFLSETWPAVTTQVLDRQAASAKAAIEAVQREAADLRNQLTGEKQRAEQIDRLHRDAANNVKVLHEQLGAAQQESIRLRATLDQKSNAASALQQQLHDLQQEATRLRATLDQKSNAIASFQQQLAEAQQESARLRAALDQKSGDAAGLQQHLLEAQREAAQLRTALEQKSGDAAGLQQHLQETQREAAKLRTALELKSDDAAGLQQHLQEIQREAAQLRTALEQKSGDAANLHQQLAETQQEAAHLRVALDQKAAKVAALEMQMSEVLVVSERKQASAVELADARVRAMESDLQTRMAEMTAVLTAERARADSLAADLEGYAARCNGADGRLAAQEAEINEYRTKYIGESTLRVQLQAQCDQTRDSLQLLRVERDSVARERDAARAEIEQLRADLQAETRAKDALQAQMDGYIAEAQAARTQPVGAASAAYGAANDENMHPAEESGPSGAGRVLVEGGNIAKMTVQQIKDALTQAGYQEEVWELANRKPAAKKTDWVALLERRSAS